VRRRFSPSDHRPSPCCSLLRRATVTSARVLRTFPAGVLIRILPFRMAFPTSPKEILYGLPASIYFLRATAFWISWSTGKNILSQHYLVGDPLPLLPLPSCQTGLDRLWLEMQLRVLGILSSPNNTTLKFLFPSRSSSSSFPSSFLSFLSPLPLRFGPLPFYLGYPLFHPVLGLLPNNSICFVD